MPGSNIPKRKTARPRPKANRKTLVSVESLQKKIPIDLARVGKIARTVLKVEGVRPVGSSLKGTFGLREEASLNIIFVSSPKIRSLNRQYLQRDYVTDVLAFDLSDTKRRGQINGDIAICADMAARNAKKYGTSLKRELTLYVVHGILHLLGYDDHAPADIRKMRRKEAEVLRYLEKGAVVSGKSPLEIASAISRVKSRKFHRNFTG